MAYNYRVYLKNDREFFIYGKEIASETKKDFAFSQSLLNLLYFNIGEHVNIFDRMGKDLLKLCEKRDKKYAVSIKKLLDSVAELHVYFEFLRLDWYDRLDKAAESGYKDISGLNRYEDLTHFPSNLIILQEQINKLFQNVFDVFLHNKPVQTKMVEYYQANKQSLLDMFSFAPQPINFEIVDNAFFTDVLCPNTIYDLIDFFLRACVKQEQAFKLCKNCNRFFAISSYLNSEYCDREYLDSGKTCKEIGALETYKRKIHENPVVGAYNKAYKRRFAWIKYRKTTQDEFYTWSKDAQGMRDKCLSGEISFDVFRAWLDT